MKKLFTKFKRSKV